jgi:hypothetical protein
MRRSNRIKSACDGVVASLGQERTVVIAVDGHMHELQGDAVQRVLQ